MPESGQIGHYNVTPKDRIIERSRGCWSCVGFDLDGTMSISKWNADRERNLALAMQTALDQPDATKVVERMLEWGANPSAIRIELTDDAPTRKIKTILRMVDKTDHLVASGGFRLCLRTPAPSDRCQADFYEARYLCSAWTGRDGHSVATEGAPLDKLPDELREEHR